MLDLASYLRFLQLYAHNMHHTVSRIVFFQDHEFLGELYGVYEAGYDSVVERIIGSSDMLPDLNAIQIKAVELLKQTPFVISENTKCFEVLLSMEKQLCEKIKAISPAVSLGTQNMLATLADDSEVRQYKLARRSKRS